MKPQLIKAAMILAVGSLLSAAFSLFYIYHKEQSLGWAIWSLLRLVLRICRLKRLLSSNRTRLSL